MRETGKRNVEIVALRLERVNLTRWILQKQDDLREW